MKTKLFTLHAESETDEIKLNKFLESVEVKQIFAQIVNESQHFWSVLVFYETLIKPEAEIAAPVIPPPEKSPAAEETENSVKPASENISLTTQQERVFNALKGWRNEKAASDGVPPYLIANNFSLVQIATAGIKSREDLIEIKGFGEKRAEKYGNDILGILDDCKSGTDNEQ